MLFLRLFLDAKVFARYCEDLFDPLFTRKVYFTFTDYFRLFICFFKEAKFLTSRHENISVAHSFLPRDCFRNDNKKSAEALIYCQVYRNTGVPE